MSNKISSLGHVYLSSVVVGLEVEVMIFVVVVIIGVGGRVVVGLVVKRGRVGSSVGVRGTFCEMGVVTTGGHWLVKVVGSWIGGHLIGSCVVGVLVTGGHWMVDHFRVWGHLNGT